MKKRNKVNRKKKRVKRCLYLFFLLAIAVTGYFVYRYFKEDQRQENCFEQLEQVEEERVKNPASPKFPEEINNPDWIGWLKIEDTSISYPVMQRKNDGEYYLHRDFYGNTSFYGTPFLDFRCTTNSDNCIIYGHNINGGRMFGALHAYAEERYYREHPKVKFRAGNENRVYKIVSVIQTTVSSPVYSFTDVGNWEEYRDYVKTMLSHSLYQTKMGVILEAEIKEKTQEEFFQRYQFLTLSTCRSWVGKDARLLVIAARKR